MTGAVVCRRAAPRISFSTLAVWCVCGFRDVNQWHKWITTEYEPRSVPLSLCLRATRKIGMVGKQGVWIQGGGKWRNRRMGMCMTLTNLSYIMREDEARRGHWLGLGMYRIVNFTIRPEPELDSTKVASQAQ